MSVQNDHIKPLTGLRWIAALFVYLSHTIGENNLPKGLLKFSENGYNGVTIFFVLSAFILTVNYRERLKLRSTLKYLTARAARILPVYYSVLAFVLLQTKLRDGSIPAWSWKHLLLIQVWYTDLNISMGLNGPAWSVGVELFFYLLFPILIFSFKKLLKTTKMSVVLTIIGVCLIGFFYFKFRNGPSDVGDTNSTHRWLYRSPLTRIGDFIYGIGLAGIYMSVQKTNKVQKVWSALAYIALVAIVFMMYFTTPRTAISWDLQYAIPAGVLILGLAMNQRSFLSRLLSTKAFLLLGEISFAFYLIHKVLPLDNYLKNTSTFAVLYYLMNLAVLCAISYSLYHFVEKPSRKYINSQFANQ